jgi:hypothetical protein
MPIILFWNAIALPQAPLVKRLLGDLKIASLSLEKGLKGRFDDAERADSLTRAYPVFRFTDEAVSAFVTRNQWGLALSGPQPGWRERLAGLGPAWNLPRTIGLRAREATLLPRVLEVLRQATSAISGSVRRFDTKPTADMFREGAVSAVDIFGMGALAFRSLGAGRAGLYVRMKQLKEGLDAPTAVVPPGGQPGGVPPPDLPLELSLDEMTHYVAGALILLPAVSALALMLGPDIVEAIRHFVIDELASVESQVFDLRASFFAALSHGLAAYSQAAVGFLIVARDYALAHLDHWVGFAGAYLDGLHGGLTAFVGQFVTFWDGVRTLIATLIGYGDQIMAIDLTELVHRALVAFQYVCDFMIHLAYDKDEKPARYVAPASFPVSVGQLVMGEGNGQRARDELARGAGRMRALLAGSRGIQLLASIGTGLKDINFRGLLRGVDLLGSRLNRPVQPLGAQPVLRYTSETEPDLVALVVRPAHEGMRNIVTNLSNTINTELQATGTGLTTMLDSAADAFDRAGDSAARSGLGPVFRRIVGDADTVASQAFPLEARRESAFEPLAQRFALAISGGFRAFEGVIGGYLGFVMQEWQAHLAANDDTPVEVNATSPRILLERARLGRVHLPEMVLHLNGNEISQSTATVVARRFATEVRAAYQRGQAQLDTWRAAAPAAAS